VVALVICKCGTRERPEQAVNLALIITFLLQRSLDVIMRSAARSGCVLGCLGLMFRRLLRFVFVLRTGCGGRERKAAN
jgi:hypothetical protein